MRAVFLVSVCWGVRAVYLAGAVGLSRCLWRVVRADGLGREWERGGGS